MQRILVVEDDFDIQELLQNFLQEAGYEVAVANDGVEALSLFAGERYDLIVLDIMLPKIDGYGVCELIRKQSDVPIIMLTALSGEEDQIKGLDLQVDDYITKPFSMPVLLRKICRRLKCYLPTLLLLREQLFRSRIHPERFPLTQFADFFRYHAVPRNASSAKLHSSSFFQTYDSNHLSSSLLLRVHI